MSKKPITGFSTGTRYAITAVEEGRHHHSDSKRAWLVIFNKPFADIDASFKASMTAIKRIRQQFDLPNESLLALVLSTLNSSGNQVIVYIPKTTLAGVGDG